jgi:hypothetical protein
VDHRGPLRLEVWQTSGNEVARALLADNHRARLHGALMRGHLLASIERRPLALFTAQTQLGLPPKRGKERRMSNGNKGGNQGGGNQGGGNQGGGNKGNGGNLPSKTGNPSGGGRGNNPPKK